MGRFESLVRRMEALEESNEALIGVVNHLLETIYDERFIKKLDKLTGNGKGKGRQEKADTI